MADFKLRAPPRVRLYGSVDINGVIGTGGLVNVAGSATATAQAAANLLRQLNLGAAGAASAQATAALLKGIRLATSATASAVGQGSLSFGAGIFSIEYRALEGYATTDGSATGPAPRLRRSQMYYESAYATKDGKLIEAFDGAHEQWGSLPAPLANVLPNRVGEFDPATGRMDEAFPENATGMLPYGSFGVKGYDNLIYCYFDAIDSLVVFTRGQYDRSIRTPSTTADGSVWSRNPDAAFAPAGRPPVLTTTLGTDALIYTTAGEEAHVLEHFTYYNIHVAYSKQFDVAVLIGGASSGGPVDKWRLTVILPTIYAGNGAAARYTARTIQLSSVSAAVNGKRWMTHQGRSGAKFVGPHVYWVGGSDQGVLRPYLFRCDIRPVLNNPAAASLGTTFAPENLADHPAGGFDKGTLAADPFNNALICLSRFGVHVYDISANTWMDATPSTGDYVSYWSSGNYPVYMHGDFVDQVASNGTRPRKTYFWGGWDGVDSQGPGYADKYQKVRSIKVTRGHAINYLNVAAFSPENPGASFGTAGLGPLRSTKHVGLTVRNGVLYLIGGDWDDNYPSNSNSTSGYKAEGSITQNGRQEIWGCDIAEAVASGTAKWYLKGNAYHAYPWTGSEGYYNTAERGPQQPDGVPVFTASDGTIWVGPADVTYSELTGLEICGQRPSYAAMFKWTPPGVNSTATTGAGINGVALGNSWTLPNQDRLANCNEGGGSPVGTPTVDYDIGFSSNSCVGWGRPNKSTAYDASDNKIRAVSLTASGTNVIVNLYTFNCTAVAGKHNWTKSADITKAAYQLGGPPNATSIFTDWGKGGIGNTVQIGRKLYFSWMAWYGVPSGYGNYKPTRRLKGTILSLDIDNPTASGLDWVPLPQMMDWWLRPFDGPESPLTFSPNPNGVTGSYFDNAGGNMVITPGQYRSMVSVGSKLVLGPEAWHKVGTNGDPWLCIYDTTTKTWECLDPPPSDSDFPNTSLGLVAVPELGEAWLCGQSALGNHDSANAAVYGWYDPQAYYYNTGLYAGRRIVRFKV